MATIVYRSVKGSPLTIAEFDNNFLNLENDKIAITRITIEVTASENFTPNFNYFQNTIQVTTSDDILINQPTGTSIEDGQQLLLKFEPGSIYL